MTTIKATEARANLYKLLDEASESHEPIQITGKRSKRYLDFRGRLAVHPRNPLSLIYSRHERIHSEGAQNAC